MTTSSGKVNVLLIGGGGREHAMATRLAASPRLGELYLADTKNPGLAALGRPLPMTIDYAKREFFPVRRFCQSESVGLVVIGPEEPLAAGLADALIDPVLPGAPTPVVFGPVREGAMLEADKAWAKELMHGASVPTAEARVFTDAAAARAFIESRNEPWVIKASGLAKGKGVFVPATLPEALEAIERVMVKREFGEAGKSVVIEERLKGREVSVFALVDGRTIYVLEACQDHKRLSDGATGPNTGGMGSLCPTPAIDEKLIEKVQRDVLVPTVDALRREGIDFRGVLYAGLMLTPAGPKVLEFNVRFGDPECQTLVRRLKTDLLTVLLATGSRKLDTVDLQWDPRPCVCVVLAARGYPEKPQAGAVIEGLAEAGAVEGVEVFHAGTGLDKEGRVVVAGGRVLNVTAVGETVQEARKRAYQAAELIRYDGKNYRTDIGTEVVG